MLGEQLSASQYLLNAVSIGKLQQSLLNEVKHIGAISKVE